MNGIVSVIKPPGMSSHQVVSWLRKVLRIRKIGHAGTLDPGASGVLVACVGKGTRVVPFLVEHDKRYVAEMTLGISTSTQDASGSTEDVNMQFSVTPKRLADVLVQFNGLISQVPPMASAIRVDGKRLYELDRAGITVERKPRQVEIKAIHVNKIWTETGEKIGFGTRILLDVLCSKGTYIRTLCHDIGEELGSHAHMSFLCRTQSGPFSLDTSHTIEEIETMVENNDLSFVRPIIEAFPDWVQVRVTPLAEKRILNGNFIYPDDFLDVPTSLVVGEQLLIVDVEGDVLAFGEMKNLGGLVCQPTRVLKGGN